LQILQLWYILKEHRHLILLQFQKKEHIMENSAVKKTQKHDFKKTIAFKFVLVVFAILAASFAALSILVYNSIKKESVKTYIEFSQSLVEKAADSLSYWATRYFKDLDVYTKSEVFETGDFETICDYIETNKKLLGEDFQYVGIADMDGHMHTSTGATTDIHDRDYFIAVTQNGKKQYIDNPVLSRTTNTYVFHLAVPAIDKNGKIFGMFCGVVPIDQLQQEVLDIKIGSGGYAFAISGDGTVIAHPTKDLVMQNTYKSSPEESGFYGIDKVIEDMIAGNINNGIITNFKTRKNNYIFYHPINGTLWSLAFSIPESQVLGTASRTIRAVLFVDISIGLLLLIIIALYLVALLKPLRGLKHSIAEIASGDADLTKRIIIKSEDEIGDVVHGFNTFTEKLHTIISRVKDSKSKLEEVDKRMQESIQETGSSIEQILANIDSVTKQITNQSASVEETAGAVTEIAQNIESLNRMIETQSSGVAEASAAVEEMIGNINSVTKGMDHMADAFNQLEKHTKTGVEKQNDVNARITQIEEQSKMLFDANKAISAIASQTNLLAMNAAIEAAHAGEAGKGFSVVADEIRKLSETSTGQSKTIGSELKKIQESITSVVSASIEAQHSFTAVNESILETDQLVQQIKGAMIESTEGSKQITDALKLMNDSTAEVRTASTEMSEGNKAILDEVRRLQEATMVMKDSVGEMSQGAKHINAQGGTLSDISRTMEDSIRSIGKEIDLFKV
jgi:methyl-accepting chemotaxis protein